MNTQKVVKKIYSIKLVRKVDEDPDFSYLGEYTDELKPGVIVRSLDKFFEDCEDDEIPEQGREYRGFKPNAGGEKIGTEDYRKNGMQDYERMESYERQNWCYIGIKAVASVGVSVNGGQYFLHDTLSSGGLWGIESDSDESYFKEVEGEELAQLKDVLIAYGFGRSTVAKAIKNAERKENY